MVSHICHIVPPYLLQSIAASASTDVSDEHKRIAEQSLVHQATYIAKREQRFKALALPRGARPLESRRAIVPDFLLKYIADDADVDEETKARARRDLEHIQKVHTSYQAQQGLTTAPHAETETLSAKPGSPKQAFYRAVYDAQHDENEDNLPGKLLRVEGQPQSKDEPANEAFDNVGRVLDFYASVFNWTSIDNKNMHVLSSVHYASEYENAFWDPEKMQMVFGDGHDFLYHFTKCLDVIGHELTVRSWGSLSPLQMGLL